MLGSAAEQQLVSRREWAVNLIAVNLIAVSADLATCTHHDGAVEAQTSQLLTPFDSRILDFVKLVC